MGPVTRAVQLATDNFRIREYEVFQHAMVADGKKYEEIRDEEESKKTSKFKQWGVQLNTRSLQSNLPKELTRPK